MKMRNLLCAAAAAAALVGSDTAMAQNDAKSQESIATITATGRAEWWEFSSVPEGGALVVGARTGQPLGRIQNGQQLLALGRSRDFVAVAIAGQVGLVQASAGKVLYPSDAPPIDNSNFRMPGQTIDETLAEQQANIQSLRGQPFYKDIPATGQPGATGGAMGVPGGMNPYGAMSGPGAGGGYIGGMPGGGPPNV